MASGMKFGFIEVSNEMELTLAFRIQQAWKGTRIANTGLIERKFFFVSRCQFNVHLARNSAFVESSRAQTRVIATSLLSARDSHV